MAKCSICNARKGKRKCLAATGYICSLCCGQTRNSDKCGGCSFYKDPDSGRNYKKTPYFPLSRMAEDMGIQDHSHVIESAICQFDQEQNCCIDDNVALWVTKLLIDKYHFHDMELSFENQLEKNGFLLVDQAIKDELETVSPEELVKILGAIYRSIKRHTNGRREYIGFIQRYV